MKDEQEKLIGDKIHHGTVIWFNGRTGYGFLEWHIDSVQQKDLFVYYSDLSMEGFRTLHKGQKVSFQLGANFEGRPKAINVKLIGN